MLNDASVGSADGTPDGVDAVAAAHVCGGSDAAVAAQAEPVALSPKGDAQIEAKLAIRKSDSLEGISDFNEGRSTFPARSLLALSV